MLSNREYVFKIFTGFNGFTTDVIVDMEPDYSLKEVTPIRDLQSLRNWSPPAIIFTKVNDHTAFRVI